MLTVDNFLFLFQLENKKEYDFNVSLSGGNLIGKQDLAGAEDFIVPTPNQFLALQVRGKKREREMDGLF